MDKRKTGGAFSATLATAAPTPGQLRPALSLCVLAALATAMLLPFAASTILALPGFTLINQTALIAAYGLSARVLFVQFGRDRSLPMLLMAGGTLYTAIIVFLQLLSFPGVGGPGRLLGAGPETTTWLWTFWHVGPPICAIVYAAALQGGQPKTFAPARTARAAAWAAAAAVALAAIAAVMATYGVPWLPHQVTGDDYADLTTSGVGPAVEVGTLAALLIVWRATRAARTVLDLWLLVSLVLLGLDNMVTLAGGARGSLGWYGGRIEATVSAFAILWAYLHEVDALHARANAAAEEAALAGAALRQAQKLEAVGRLTGGIAHDFNNLLMVVTNGFEIIRRSSDDRARVVKIADAGLEAAQRGARLTRQLLTFARCQNLQPETLNLNASLLDFEPLAHKALSHGMQLALSLDPSLHPTWLDRGEFESAVLNLIVNAADAMPANDGHICIKTRNAVWLENVTPLPRGAEAPAPGEYSVVAVSDNGIGMEEATRLQVFEPFFTTKEFGKGSGLGLSQVYGFARGAGGTVMIMSEPEQGTTVEMWLPRAQKGPVQAALSTGPASGLRQAQPGETVLAVEDEPAVLSAVAENLEEIGYRVLLAASAAEALEHLRSDKRIDVLFSDVVMPGGMNGVQLSVEARRIRPELRIVLTSGYTGEALTGEHDIPSGVPVLTKPYRRAELVERLTTAMRA